MPASVFAFIVTPAASVPSAPSCSRPFSLAAKPRPRADPPAPSDSGFAVPCRPLATPPAPTPGATRDTDPDSDQGPGAAVPASAAPGFDSAAGWYNYLIAATFYSPACRATFRLVEQIGAGGHGMVFAAEPLEPLRRAHAATRFVVKYVLERAQGIHEGLIQGRLTAAGARNIAPLVDVVPDVACEHGGAGGVFLLLQYCDGRDALTWTLRSHYPENDLPGLTEWDALALRQAALRNGLLLFRGVLRAVRECHTRGIYHRDIKLDNILLETDPAAGTLAVRLSDFGVATVDAVSNQIKHGTESTMAPEVLLGRPGDTYSPEYADRWSLGIVLYQLATGLCLWPCADPAVSDAFAYYRERAAFGKLMGARAVQTLSRGLWQLHLPDRLARLIAGLLRVDPLQRVGLDTAEQAVAELVAAPCHAP